jgi:hypothetical protein
MRWFAFMYAHAHRATKHMPTVHSASAPGAMHGFARVRLSAPWCARAQSFQNLLVTFFRPFLFPPFHFSPHAVQPPLPSSPFFSHTPYTKPLKSSKPTTHIHHRITIAPPRRRLSHFLISPPFLLFSHPNLTSPNLFFLSIFFCLQRHIPIHGLCHFWFLCWLIVFLQGVGVDFGVVFKPLFVETPTTCLIKFPNQFQHA